MTEPQKPGPLDSAGTQPATPPQNDAATNTGTPPPDQPSPPQAEVEVSPESEGTPVAPTTGRDDKGRFLKNEDRAKAGAEGGWLGDPRAKAIPEDVKRELLDKPWLVQALKEKVAFYEGQRAPQTPEKPPVDPAEQYAEEMSALNDRHTTSPMPAKDYFREEARIKERFTRSLTERVAAETATNSMTRMTEQQEISYISQQPEINDPDFRAMMAGRYGQGGVSRVQAYEQTKAWWASKFQPQGNGNGHKAVPPPPPAVNSVGGEMRSVAQPPTTPSGSIYEKFARTQGGKAMAEKARQMNGF